MSDKTYAESIAELLAGKIVEIHTGDTKHIQEYNDYTIQKKSIIRGKIKSAQGDLLIVQCITDKGGTTLAYINTLSIAVITEYDGNNVANIYLDEDSK